MKILITKGTSAKPHSCHCEEQGDEAIPLNSAPGLPRSPAGSLAMTLFAEIPKFQKLEHWAFPWNLEFGSW